MSKTLGSFLLAFAFLQPALFAQQGGPLESVPESELPPVTEPAPTPAPAPAPAPTPVVTPEKLGQRIHQVRRHERCERVRELVERHREELRAEQKRRMEALRQRLAEKQRPAGRRR